MHAGSADRSPATPRCPVCGEPERDRTFPRARGPARTHPLVTCRTCGLVSLERVPSLGELRQAQGECYGAPRRKFHPLVEKAVRLMRVTRVRLASRLVREGGPVLDIGCGRGIFLRMMQERGHPVRGTELDAASAANVLPGIPVDLGDVVPGRYEPGSFALISLWHVLEHLREPELTLRACHEALEPGGALLIAVPNFDSIQARISGEHWFHLDLPRHVCHFTPATLEKLLAKTGFRIERRRTGQWEMDPFGLLQSLLNRIGLRHNGIYDTLRSNRAAKRDLSALHRAALVVIFFLGMPPCVLASLVFRLAGRDGTLIVVARK